MQCLTNEIIFCGFRKHSLSGLQLQSGMQCVQRSDCRAANLAVFRRRKAFLLCKNPCGGTAVGMGSPAQSGIAAPAQRNFQRKFALRRVGFHKFVVPPTSNRSKVRNNSRLVRCPYRAAPGSLRGSSPSVWERVQRKPFSRVFFGQLLRGGSTPRFFSQIRSVGSKPTRLAGHCQKITPPDSLSAPAGYSPRRRRDFSHSHDLRTRRDRSVRGRMSEPAPSVASTSEP